MVWRRIKLDKEIREATYFMNDSIVVYIPFVSDWDWNGGVDIARNTARNRILLHSCQDFMLRIG